MREESKKDDTKDALAICAPEEQKEENEKKEESRKEVEEGDEAEREVKLLKDAAEGGQVEDESEGNDQQPRENAGEKKKGKQKEESKEEVAELRIRAVRLKDEEDELDMVEETKKDDSMKHLRELADLEERGYSWSSGRVIRTRLDNYGRASKQLCLPTPFRKKALTAAHENLVIHQRTRWCHTSQSVFTGPLCTATQPSTVAHV